MIRRLVCLLLTLFVASTVAFAAPEKNSTKGKGKNPAKTDELPREFRRGKADGKITTANWGPKRDKPVYTGPFQVDLVLISFPDCDMPEPEKVRNDLDHICGGEYTIKDYYDDYSQNTTYPVLVAYPTVYVAPKPYGYYSRWNRWNNKIGWGSDGEGAERVRKLRADALEFCRKSVSGGFKKGVMPCYVYCHRLNKELVETHLREAYPKPKESWQKDEIETYNPSVAWGEPMWPNSLPQASWPCDGGVMVHELGHVLGSPDYYHAPEKHDGVEGAPALPWSHSPTGMAYDRVIYHAFVPPSTYPVIKEDGTYTLDPRCSRVSREKGAEQPVLGYFIPSSHPNYMFYVEYVYQEKKPVGTPGAQGMLIHVINVTFSSPMMGPPDLCYTYRRDDKFFKATGKGEAYFRTGDSFTMESNPAARIPPLIPGGIEITDIEEHDGKCSFKLTFTKPKLTPKDLKDALLPRIRLVDVEEVLPTSVHPVCDVMYRGEPLMDEYGFTWDTKKEPTIQKNKLPLYHRDRYDARIIDLKPNTTYYIRAYVKNENGVTYSKREIEVKTPPETKEVPALLTDKLLNSWHIKQYYFKTDADLYYDSANSIITLMSLGVYYGVQPGGVATGKGAPKPIEIRKVHTNPSDSRPGFRMTEFNEYLGAMKSLAARSGLRARGFGKMAEWQKTLVKELKIKDPKKAFIPIKTEGDLVGAKDQIKAWLDLSQPVLLIRENDFMPNVTHEIYPLDIAIIDGYNSSGDWHVTFPLGSDRGSKTQNGYYEADTLLISVKDALLFFYRP